MSSIVSVYPIFLFILFAKSIFQNTAMSSHFFPQEINSSSSSFPFNLDTSIISKNSYYHQEMPEISDYKKRNYLLNQILSEYNRFSGDLHRQSVSREANSKVNFENVIKDDQIPSNFITNSDYYTPTPPPLRYFADKIRSLTKLRNKNILSDVNKMIRVKL